ncbi:unnamed protein product [Amoebophrya sp. A120]|nr:unnamed protein product [Amoebophrya sp. A120]|eukprot:GSA120T00021388001.1
MEIPSDGGMAAAAAAEEQRQHQKEKMMEHQGQQKGETQQEQQGNSFQQQMGMFYAAQDQNAQWYHDAQQQQQHSSWLQHPSYFDPAAQQHQQQNPAAAAMDPNALASMYAAAAQGAAPGGGAADPATNFMMANMAAAMANMGNFNSADATDMYGAAGAAAANMQDYYMQAAAGYDHEQYEDFYPGPQENGGENMDFDWTKFATGGTTSGESNTTTSEPPKKVDGALTGEQASPDVLSVIGGGDYSGSGKKKDLEHVSLDEAAAHSPTSYPGGIISSKSHDDFSKSTTDGSYSVPATTAGSTTLPQLLPRADSPEDYAVEYYRAAAGGDHDATTEEPAAGTKTPPARVNSYANKFPTPAEAMVIEQSNKKKKQLSNKKGTSTTPGTGERTTTTAGEGTNATKRIEGLQQALNLDKSLAESEDTTAHGRKSTGHEQEDTSVVSPICGFEEPQGEASPETPEEAWMKIISEQTPASRNLDESPLDQPTVFTQKFEELQCMEALPMLEETNAGSLGSLEDLADGSTHVPPEGALPRTSTQQSASAGAPGGVAYPHRGKPPVHPSQQQSFHQRGNGITMNMVCRFWWRGNCVKGTYCEWAHQIPEGYHARPNINDRNIPIAIGSEPNSRNGSGEWGNTGGSQNPTSGASPQMRPQNAPSGHQQMPHGQRAQHPSPNYSSYNVPSAGYGQGAYGGYGGSSYHGGYHGSYGNYQYGAQNAYGYGKGGRQYQNSYSQQMYKGGHHLTDKMNNQGKGAVPGGSVTAPAGDNSAGGAAIAGTANAGADAGGNSGNPTPKSGPVTGSPSKKPDDPENTSSGEQSTAQQAGGSGTNGAAAQATNFDGTPGIVCPMAGGANTHRKPGQKDTSTTLCYFWKIGKCEKGDKCGWAHPPDLYRSGCSLKERGRPQVLQRGGMGSVDVRTMSMVGSVGAPGTKGGLVTGNGTTAQVAGAVGAQAASSSGNDQCAIGTAGAPSGAAGANGGNGDSGAPTSDAASSSTSNSGNVLIGWQNSSLVIANQQLTLRSPWLLMILGWMITVFCAWYVGQTKK